MRIARKACKVLASKDCALKALTGPETLGAHLINGHPPLAAPTWARLCAAWRPGAMQGRSAPHGCRAGPAAHAQKTAGASQGPAQIAWPPASVRHQKDGQARECRQWVECRARGSGHSDDMAVDLNLTSELTSQKSHHMRDIVSAPYSRMDLISGQTSHRSHHVL
eukprot:scaffold118655_cov16-Tisochrysis_lutea.AAC.1